MTNDYFSVLMKTDMHTYSSVNGTIPVLRLINSCTVQKCFNSTVTRLKQHTWRESKIRTPKRQKKRKPLGGVWNKEQSLDRVQEPYWHAIKHMVWFLESSCGEPAVGLDDPHGSFPAQDILRFHEPDPRGRKVWPCTRRFGVTHCCPSVATCLRSQCCSFQQGISFCACTS